MPREHEIKPRLSPSNGVNPTIANGEHIADIFLLWDCFQNTWSDGSPILLRLENFDLLIEAPESRIATTFEVCNKDFIDDSDRDAGNDTACLIWRRHPDARFVAGEIVSDIKTCNRSIFLHTESGEVLQL